MIRLALIAVIALWADVHDANSQHFSAADFKSVINKPRRVEGVRVGDSPGQIQARFAPVSDHVNVALRQSIQKHNVDLRSASTVNCSAFLRATNKGQQFISFGQQRVWILSEIINDVMHQAISWGKSSVSGGHNNLRNDADLYRQLVFDFDRNISSQFFPRVFSGKLDLPLSTLGIPLGNSEGSSRKRSARNCLPRSASVGFHRYAVAAPSLS